MRIEGASAQGELIQAFLAHTNAQTIQFILNTYSRAVKQQLVSKAHAKNNAACALH